MLVVGLFAAAMPVMHMRGAHYGEIAQSPGGFFFVQSGLILKSENEAELAGVMAHEIAHVAARHGTRQATRGEIAQLATIPLIFMGGAAAYGIYQASGLIIPVSFLKFSRTFEAEADYLGVQYMYKAGYDPTAFVDFFEKIQTMEKRRPGTMSKSCSIKIFPPATAARTNRRSLSSRRAGSRWCGRRRGTR